MPRPDMTPAPDADAIAPRARTHLDYGVIGNGQVAALVAPDAGIRFFCLPRLDGDPVFNGLLGGNGRFDITLEDLDSSDQTYDRNTAVLVTTAQDTHGARIRITDFCPRFRARGRDFRPISLVRVVEVLEGAPRIKVVIHPTFAHNSRTVDPVLGTHHISWADSDTPFRVTTNAPITHVANATAFVPGGDVAFVLGPDESLSDDPLALAHDWLAHTREHWQTWVRALSVPLDYQDAVIRAAIGLKMCVFEDTGGMVAALTTSIPEHEGSIRNWDYRYCWVRDAYFAISALARLSDISTRDHHAEWLLSVATKHAGSEIQPLFGIGLEERIEEWESDHLPGFEGHSPVRIGNAAYTQKQNDIYGQIILGLAPLFFDQRRDMVFGETEFHLLERIGQTAVDVWDTSDAGIWEFRDKSGVHSSSVMFCWAACDRLALIAGHLGLAQRQVHWRDHADTIREGFLKRAYNPDRKAFTASFGGEHLDASLLLVARLGLLPADDDRFRETVARVDDELRSGNHVYRYVAADDFGEPETAFTACTFWHIEALHSVGRTDDARAMFENLLGCRNAYGYLSEDIVCQDETLWGNYPQTYCLAGIIDCARALSRPWSGIL